MLSDDEKHELVERIERIADQVFTDQFGWTGRPGSVPPWKQTADETGSSDSIEKIQQDFPELYPASNNGHRHLAPDLRP